MLCACRTCINTINFTAIIIPPIQYRSCFISALHENCTQDKCVLQRPPGSRSNVYRCCCRGILCNTKLIYPDLNATSPLLSRTAVTADTTSTDGEVSMDTTSPGMCWSLCVRMH